MDRLAAAELAPVGSVGSDDAVFAVHDDRRLARVLKKRDQFRGECGVSGVRRAHARIVPISVKNDKLSAIFGVFPDRGHVVVS